MFAALRCERHPRCFVCVIASASTTNDQSIADQSLIDDALWCVRQQSLVSMSTSHDARYQRAFTTMPVCAVQLAVRAGVGCFDYV